VTATIEAPRVVGAQLTATSVTKRFGGLVAVDDVSLTAEPGQITSLIGPNGAGKTTFFNCLTGLLQPDRGTVRLGDIELTKLPTPKRAAAGLGRTFQRLEIFTGLTVFQNLQVAAEASDTASVLGGLIKLRHRDDPAIVQRVHQILRDIGIADLAEVTAGSLSTGLLRLVELGRALCASPRVLLLDEPASGLDATETERLQQILVRLAGEGMTILLVEHDVDLVMAVSQSIYVMEFGRLIASGTPDEIRTNEAVRTAYLGVAGDDEAEAGDAAAT
jgi:branched-chain amino acid transport system ATP-binding protein